MRLPIGGRSRRVMQNNDICPALLIGVFGGLRVLSAPADELGITL